MMVDVLGTTGSDPESMSYRIIKTVAEYKGVEPERLEPALFEAVDPDVLDRLSRRDRGVARNWQFVFAYAGCEVTVESDGSISIASLDDGSTLDTPMTEDMTKYR